MAKQARRTIYYSSIDAAPGIIGRKYKAIILHDLLKKMLRYHELARLVPQATP